MPHANKLEGRQEPADQIEGLINWQMAMKGLPFKVSLGLTARVVPRNLEERAATFRQRDWCLETEIGLFWIRNIYLGVTDVVIARLNWSLQR